MPRPVALFALLALWALSPSVARAGDCCPKKAAGEEQAAQPAHAPPPAEATPDVAATPRACCVRHGAHGLGHSDCTCCFRSPTPLAPERAVRPSPTAVELLPLLVPAAVEVAPPLLVDAPDAPAPRPPPRTASGPRAPPIS